MARTPPPNVNEKDNFIGNADRSAIILELADRPNNKSIIWEAGTVCHRNVILNDEIHMKFQPKFKKFSIKSVSRINKLTGHIYIENWILI